MFLQSPAIFQSHYVAADIVPLVHSFWIITIVYFWGEVPDLNVTCPADLHAQVEWMKI